MVHANNWTCMLDQYWYWSSMVERDAIVNNLELPTIADAFLACPGASSTFSLRPAAGQRSYSAPALRMASSPPPPGSEPALRKQWAGKQMDDWMVYATKKAERTDEEWKKIEEERSLKQAEVLPPARDFSLCGSFLQPGSRAALTRRHLALSDAAKRRLKRSWTRSRPSWRPRWPPAAVSSLQNVPQPAASLRTETPALALRVACLHHGVLGHVLSHLAAKEDGDQAFVAATEAVRAFGPPRPPPSAPRASSGVRRAGTRGCLPWRWKGVADRRGERAAVRRRGPGDGLSAVEGCRS